MVLCFAIDLQDAIYSVVLNYYENKVSFTYYKKFKIKWKLNEPFGRYMHLISVRQKSSATICKER